MSKKRLLIVDDEPDFLDAATLFLQSRGYEVETAADGNEALQKIKKGIPDLAILDLVLPKVDGWRIAKQIKEKSPKTPVLMLSALVAKSGQPEMWEVGDFYLAKPVSPEELLTKIQEMLGESA